MSGRSEMSEIYDLCIKLRDIIEGAKDKRLDNSDILCLMGIQKTLNELMPQFGDWTAPEELEN